MVLASPLLNKSPWEEPARVRILAAPHAARPRSRRSSSRAQERSTRPWASRTRCRESCAASCTIRSGECSSSASSRTTARDFIYERASLYSTAGVFLARELDRPLIMELNSPLALEQTTYRATGLGELAAQGGTLDPLARRRGARRLGCPARLRSVARGRPGPGARLAERGGHRTLPAGVEPDPEVNGSVGPGRQASSWGSSGA